MQHEVIRTIRDSGALQSFTDKKWRKRVDAIKWYFYIIENSKKKITLLLPAISLVFSINNSKYTK